MSVANIYAKLSEILVFGGSQSPSGVDAYNGPWWWSGKGCRLNWGKGGYNLPWRWAGVDSRVGCEVVVVVTSRECESGG